MSTKDSVSRASDLMPVPLKLTVKDDLVTLHLHHIMVSKETDSHEYYWKALRDPSKPCSTQQMSKALHLLLPYPVLCASKAERVFVDQRNIKSNILDALPGLSCNNITFPTYLSGSKGENLDIPLTFSLDGKVNITSVSKSDLDLLIIMPMQPQEANRIIVDEDKTHSGYFRCLGKEPILACGVSEFVFQQSQLVGHIQGPSIHANTPMKQVDHVLAFQFHGWPEGAEDIYLRKHHSGWPSEDMVEEFVRDGCHMVLKSHPFTDVNLKNEFRYSFSLAEKRLAASLSKSQRFVYMYLKLLHQENFSSRDEIASYHMKTIMFWECEEVPPEEWTSDNDATRLLSLLDRLLKYLKERNLPSFFIPDNNLIDHIPTERIKHLHTVVTDIRANIMTYILKFLKQNRFLGYPLSLGNDTIEEIGRFALKTVITNSESDMEQANVDLAVHHDNKVGWQTNPNPSHTMSQRQRINLHPLSTGEQTIQEISTFGMRTESEADMIQAHVDLAVRCAAHHVADFYLSEKTVLDTTLYFMQPGEGTLAAYLIRCYLHNILLPLRSALYILQQAWQENEPGDAGCRQSELIDKVTMCPESGSKDKPTDCPRNELPEKPRALPESKLIFKATTQPESKPSGKHPGCTESEQGEKHTSCPPSGSNDTPSVCMETKMRDKSAVVDSDYKIWECLTSFDDCVSVDGLSMVDDKQTEKLIQQFLDHELPGLMSAVQRLQKILGPDTINVDFEPNDCTSKLRTAWRVLLHLVAYCYIIVNRKEDCTAKKYLGGIQNLQEKLSQTAGLEDLSYCCQQLHAFSLFYLGCDKEVEEDLLTSKLKPTAADWLRKLLSAKQESTATKLPRSKWAWESVSLITYDVKMKEEGSAFIEEWLEHQPYSHKDFSSATSFFSRQKAQASDSNPVGRLSGTHDRTYWDSCIMRWEVDTAQNLLVSSNPVGRLSGTHDRTYWDSCMMRWEGDTAQNLLVPKENLLCQSLQSMMEELLSVDQVSLDAMHPSCTLIVAKYLLLNKDTEKGIVLLEQNLDHPRSIVDCYRVFPLEVRLMLNDRVLTGRNLRRRDHFDFSIIMYALYLLVRAHVEKGDLYAAQIKVDKMMQLCDKDANGQLDCSYPWQVSTNNLTLLGTAQNMCGNKAGSLIAFVYAELVSQGQTLLNLVPQSLQMKERTMTQAVKDCISILSNQLNISSIDALRVCLGVLYPEADLSTAMDRLVHYCTEGGSFHKEYSSLSETISDLSDHR